MKKQPYWHFCHTDKDGIPRLGFDDNREVKVGETLTVQGKPVLCEHGLHASIDLWDALAYAHGFGWNLCRVELSGEVVHGDEKSVASARKVIAMLDPATTDKLLRDYACWCALQVIHMWDAPSIVRQYLETGNESLRGAAWEAASAERKKFWGESALSSWEAASAASRAASNAVPSSAAWAAVRNAARAVASAVASAAGRDAAKTEYAEELERRAIAAMGQEITS